MGKSMKTFLRQSITDLIGDCEIKIEELTKKISIHEGSLIKVENINFKKSHYEVKLNSFTEDCGGVSIIISSYGSLENAIITAESEFMKNNDDIEINTDYLVSILINKEFYKVPNIYWEKYKFNK